MDKLAIKKEIAEAIGALGEIKRKYRSQRSGAWIDVRRIVGLMGGKVSFRLPENLRRRNENAKARFFEQEGDEESRAFLERWPGPLYGAALRENSFAVEYSTGTGDQVGYIDSVEVTEDGTLRIAVYGEDSIVMGLPEAADFINEADVLDPLPVILFLEGAAD